MYRPGQSFTELFDQYLAQLQTEIDVLTPADTEARRQVMALRLQLRSLLGEFNQRPPVLEATDVLTTAFRENLIQRLQELWNAHEHVVSKMPLKSPVMRFDMRYLWSLDAQVDRENGKRGIHAKLAVQTSFMTTDGEKTFPAGTFLFFRFRDIPSDVSTPDFVTAHVSNSSEEIAILTSHVSPLGILIHSEPPQQEGGDSGSNDQWSSDDGSGGSLVLAP